MERTLVELQKHPVFQALDPRRRQFMEVRSLPKELNSFWANDIEVIALIPFALFPHIKTVPTWQMMFEDFIEGRYKDKHTIVIDSSGNTAYAVARLARAFGFKDVKVVLAADVPPSKKELLSALSSVEIIEVSGGKSVSKRAEEEAQNPGHYRLNQYSHMGNVHAHELYTGPEILRVLGGNIANISVVAVAMGSGGTLAGVGRFLKGRSSKATVLGVRPSPGEQVPGARDAKRMAEVVTLPWEATTDTVVEVGRKESFTRTRQLSGYVEPQPGPTSGLAWGGLEKYLTELPQDELDKLRGKCAAFICPDDGRFYSERMTGELDTGQGL